MFYVEVKLPAGGTVTDEFVELSVARLRCQEILKNGMTYVIGHGQHDKFKPTPSDVRLYEEVQKEHPIREPVYKSEMEL